MKPVRSDARAKGSGSPKAAYAAHRRVNPEGCLKRRREGAGGSAYSALGGVLRGSAKRLP